MGEPEVDNNFDDPMEPADNLPEEGDQDLKIDYYSQKSEPQVEGKPPTTVKK